MVPPQAAAILRRRFGPEWADVATGPQVDDAIDEAIRTDPLYVPLRSTFLETCLREMEARGGDTRLPDVLDHASALCFGSAYSKVALILTGMFLTDLESGCVGAPVAPIWALVSSGLHEWKRRPREEVAG